MVEGERPSTGTPSQGHRRTTTRCFEGLELAKDPKLAAQQYIKLRQCIRHTFEGYLRNMNLKSLHSLEASFQKHGGELNSSTFMKVITNVFAEPQGSQQLSEAEQRFIQQFSCLMLFESMDVDRSGEASWMEFVEFVCAIAEELRLKAAEESGQVFEFTEAEQVPMPFRPALTKCKFDRVFYWKEHPMDCAVVFEEGQTGFHLHSKRTLARKRRVDGGHTQELLSATFLPAPFCWVVTSGNDNMVCFWDENFNLVKRWEVGSEWTGVPKTQTSVGAMCWCPELNAIYAADHFSEKFRAWRITDAQHLRSLDRAYKPDKDLDLLKESLHKKAIQAICWMSPLQCLATASLDTTVQIFDLVQMKRAHVLTAHKRGLTCLQYCPKNHSLLSAGFDNFISIWDPGAGTLSFTLEGHQCSVASLCSVPDTDYEYASIDFDGIVNLWDVRRLVNVQSFCATDRQAEKNSEIEALEPRTLAAIGRDRMLISGRRMVVFDREASNPKITADWPIHAITFNERRIEIVTPIKNDLYVWCALTGDLQTVHDNVIEGTITAISLGMGERRVFVGADDGVMHVVNYACGALLKKLRPHAYEVSQITCIPDKILTLSAPEKVVVIHDDTETDRSMVLKTIDISGAGSPINFALDGRDMFAVTSEDAFVAWYNMDFAKQVSSSEEAPVNHQSPVSSCLYFKEAPLVVTADADSNLIFWSLQPLRKETFFNKVNFSFGASEQSCGISAMALSWPDEEHGWAREEFIFVGSDRGSLACICIRSVTNTARAQAQNIIYRKEHGEAAAVISGRIFDDLPKPNESSEYCFALGNTWLVENAHLAGIQQVVVCKRKLPVVITLGSDACVRIWSHGTGEALGTLEQGLPEGLSNERGTEWLFPMDAQQEFQNDLRAITKALEEKEDSEDESALPEPSIPSVVTSPSASERNASKKTLAPSASAPTLRGTPTSAAYPGGGGVTPTGSGSIRGAAASSPSRAGSKFAAPGRGDQGPISPSSSPGKSARRKQSKGLGHSSSSPKLGGGSSQSPKKKPVDRMVALTMPRGGATRDDEWYAGPHAASFFEAPAQHSPPMGLPKLPNGRTRPRFSDSRDLVAAARRLSSALGDIEVRSKRDFC